MLIAPWFQAITQIHHQTARFNQSEQVEIKLQESLIHET